MCASRRLKMGKRLSSTDRKRFLPSRAEISIRSLAGGLSRVNRYGKLRIKRPIRTPPAHGGGDRRCISYSNLSARRTYVRPVGRHVCYTNSTPLTRAPRQFPYRFRCFTLNNRSVPARAVFIVFVHTPRTCRPTISPIARFSNGKALDERWPRFL